MNADSAPSTALGHPTDWVATVRELGPRFAARAAAHDAHDSFVAGNYAELRERRVFSAGVPAELGGGGASHRELCDVLRTLAHSCGSTALALAMHTHVLASTVWRWHHAGAPVDAFLRRVAAEELILVTSGGSDFLAGSGVAEKVEGGYQITARKVFGS
jgi:alkylation response protein AidB-like acyl-CoA dehydrogenase